MSEPQEVWKPVVGYETTHEVSNRGRVRLIQGGDVLKRNIHRTTPNVLIVAEDGYTKKVSVCAIVKATFGPDPSVYVMDEDANLPGEEWRSIPGWEGLYAASNLGRIRNLAGGSSNCRPGKILHWSLSRG